MVLQLRRAVMFSASDPPMASAAAWVLLFAAGVNIRLFQLVLHKFAIVWPVRPAVTGLCIQHLVSASGGKCVRM